MKTRFKDNGERDARGFGRRHNGFTLIELLTVIAIIGLLAGLIIGLAPGVHKTMSTKRVQTDCDNLVTAIENYKSKFGHYPPDNVISTIPLVVNDATNQLYYELTGWIYSKAEDKGYGSLERQGPLYQNTVQSYFHKLGFVNSASLADPPDVQKEVKNFLPNLKPNMVGKAVSGPAGVEVLLVQPVLGPGTPFKTWHYRCTSPTNNPSTFDLWAEVVVGNETKIIGNWKQ